MKYEVVEINSNNVIASFRDKDYAEWFKDLYNDAQAENISLKLADKNLNPDYNYQTELEKHPDFYINKPGNAWEKFINGVILLERI
jgi:hypothetical protein